MVDFFLGLRSSFDGCMLVSNEETSIKLNLKLILAPARSRKDSCSHSQSLFFFFLVRILYVV